MRLKKNDEKEGGIGRPWRFVLCLKDEELEAFCYIVR